MLLRSPSPAPSSLHPTLAVLAFVMVGLGVSASGMYPTIAGQYANYLEHSLKDYRSGARKNAIMGAQAVNLTDAEIKQLAKWYAAQQGPLYTPSVHGDLKP